MTGSFIKKFAAVALVASAFAVSVAAPASADEWRGQHGSFNRSSYVVVRDHDRFDHGRDWDHRWDRPHYYPPVVYREAPPPVVYYQPAQRVVYAPYYAAPRPYGSTVIFNWR